MAAVEAAMRMAQAESEDKSLSLWREDAGFRTRKRRIAARSAGQADYVKAMREHELVFGLGPAGTGKTYLAVAAAIDLLMGGQVERVILSRPAVEAGERLGFLPGDLREKVDPYLRSTTCCRPSRSPNASAMARSRWRRSPLCAAARWRAPLSS